MGFDYTSMESYKKLQKLPDIIKEDPNEIYYNFRNVGKGSFCNVYCAEDRKNNRLVALKKFKLDEKTGDEDIKDIINEKNIIKTIKHENCVGYYGTFLTKTDKIYLSMEYCIGSVIDAITVLKTNLEENIILEILYSTIKALSYLHNLGYIHRDVKGANILISIDGVVKLSDFGSTSPHPFSSEFVGSPYWMAPELLLAMDNKDYDCSVDIWSFGITAIELVNKKPPHMEVHPMSAIYKVVELPAPKIDAPEYSKNMTNLINSCLQKETKTRPSASELLERIEKFYKYPPLDRLAVYGLIMKTNKMIDLKIKDISTNVMINVEPSPQNTEIFGEEEDVGDIAQELVELCKNREQGSQISEEISNDIEKTIEASHTLTSRIFTSANNIMAIHLRELINAQDQNSSTEYNILQSEYMKKRDKENLKAIGKLVRSQQVVIKNLEKKNNEAFEDMISGTESLFKEKMNKFEQEMNKIKISHGEILEKHIKNAGLTHPLTYRQSSVYGDDQLSGVDQKKTPLHRENNSTSAVVSQNHKNSRVNVTGSKEEDIIRARQEMEGDFLKEELDLLKNQLNITHNFLIKSHADISSFQAKIMEEKHTIRIKQIDEKHAMEKVKYNQYSDDGTKTQTKCHNSILNNLPKKVKAGVFQMKKECLDYVRDYKILQNSEFSKKNSTKKEENIKNSKKQNKVDTDNHIKEYKKDMVAKIKNFKKETVESVNSMILNEKATLLSSLVNHGKEMIKCQQTYMDNTKDKMVNKRLKLSNELTNRRKCLDEKMEADRKRFQEYSVYRNTLLKKEHEKDFEILKKYLKLSVGNIPGEF